MRIHVKMVQRAPHLPRARGTIVRAHPVISVTTVIKVSLATVVIQQLSFVLNSLLFSEFCKDQNPCVNGNCTKLSVEPGYKCDCDKGYSGINCTLGNVLL